MSERTPRRSTRHGGTAGDGRPPLSAVNVRGSGATPASHLTARTRSVARQHEVLNHQTAEDEAMIEEMVLADLGGTPNEQPSPLRRLDDVVLPTDYEEAFDRRAYADNAGASDSEDEEDIGMNANEVLDRQQHLADAMTALMDDIHTIGQQMNNNNNDDDAGNVAPVLSGAPAGWIPPMAPEGWRPSTRDEASGEPAFETVDNPGDWTEYTYRPKFKEVRKNITQNGKTKVIKAKEYKHHALPTGCMPVPEGKDGKRTLGNWEFHHKGWKPVLETTFRDGATRDNLFPAARGGSLDGTLLKKLGLKADTLLEADKAPDALFFYQLLLPISDPAKTGIDNDPRKGFYTEVSRHTNGYAYNELGLGYDYGHKFTPVTSPELLRFDGSLVKHGVRGGGKSSMMLRFDKSRDDNSAFDGDIASAFTRSRWCEIKRSIKLCDNMAAAKKGQPNYEPAYKYDKIFDTLIHNVNAVTKYANTDQCVDESTFGHGGYGPMGDGLFGYLRNKPFTRGGQLVLCCDTDRIRPRAYIHRHTAHKQMLTDTKAAGPNEIALIYEKLETLIKAGKSTNPHRPVPIFKDQPHITADNYFSGESIMDYAIDKGFGMLMTCRRDRFPKGIAGQYVHKEASGTQHRAKSARHLNPVVAVNRVSQDLKQLVSFQSTGGCNFIAVNSLNECQLYVTPKERGQKNYKRHWAIEMNEARELYLKTYGAIDRMDHHIKNCNMGYRSWKYWHAPMTHAKAMAVTIAYDMYIEVCEGKLDPAYKVDKPVTFFRWREKLAKQMLHYSPTHRKYHGDEKFRCSTQQHAAFKKRASSPSPRRTLLLPSSSSDEVSTMGSVASLATRDTVEANSNRLCGDLSSLEKHEQSMKQFKNHRSCEICGKPAYWCCAKCPKKPVLHRLPNKHSTDGISCHIKYHNTIRFGITRAESTKRKWNEPNEETSKAHAKQMKQVCNAIAVANATVLPSSS